MRIFHLETVRDCDSIPLTLQRNGMGASGEAARGGEKYLALEAGDQTYIG